MGFVDECGKIWRNIHYGELHRILECLLDDREMWGGMKGKRRLLAVITPCKTDGNDASKSVTEYTKLHSTIVTDLQSVQCVVGRVRRRNTWGIIDRNSDEARPEFISQVDATTNQVVEEYNEIDSELDSDPDI